MKISKHGEVVVRLILVLFLLISIGLSSIHQAQAESQILDDLAVAVLTDTGFS
jgi:hypothetical protein